MLSYITRRILSLIPTLLVVSVVAFLVVYVIPGRLVIALLGTEAIPETTVDLNAGLGFDYPLLVQYTNWFINILHGDWGQSYLFRVTVLDAIGEYFAPTFSLTVFVRLTSLVVVVFLGILTACRRGTCVDMVTVPAFLLGIATPGFLLSVFLTLFSGVHLRWLPVVGYVQMSQGILEHLRYLLLPTLPLGVVQVAYITRMSHSAILDVLYMNYIYTARAKGLKESVVVLVYRLKSASPTILTVVGQLFGSLVTGTIVTEALSNIPGLGMLATASTTHRDAFVIQRAVLFTTLIYVLVNLTVDILYDSMNLHIQLEDK